LAAAGACQLLPASAAELASRKDEIHRHPAAPAPIQHLTLNLSVRAATSIRLHRILEQITQEDEQDLCLDRLVDNTKSRTGLSIEKTGFLVDSRPTVLSDK